MSTKRARTVEDDSPSGNGGGRHTRHASRACEGCRGRKYRCDGAKPACSNCESRNQACLWSQRVDKRRALDKAQADELNATIERLEHEQRRTAEENALLQYQVVWLKEKLAQLGLSNLPIPAELPNNPYSIAAPSLAVSIPDSPAGSPPFPSSSVSPGSSSSSPYNLPSPFFPSPMDPTVALPDVENPGLLTVPFRSRAASDSRSHAMATRVSKGRRTSAPTLPHPNMATRAHTARHAVSPGVKITAASMKRESGVEHMTALLSNTALASPAAALPSTLPPFHSAPTFDFLPRVGPTATTKVFDTPFASSSSRFNAPSPSSSTFAGTPPPPSPSPFPSMPSSFHPSSSSSFTSAAFHGALSLSPVSSFGGGSSPSTFPGSGFNYTMDAAESSSVLFSPSFSPSFEGDIML